MLWGVILRTDLTVLPPSQVLGLQAYTLPCPEPVGVKRCSFKKKSKVYKVKKKKISKTKRIGEGRITTCFGSIFFSSHLKTLYFFNTIPLYYRKMYITKTMG